MFNTVLRRNVLDLEVNDDSWATNYKETWTSAPLQQFFDGTYNTVWDSGSFNYLQPNGKTVANMHVYVSFTRIYWDIAQSFEDSHVTDYADHVRALNALVFRSVQKSDPDNSQYTQVGANKIYLKGGCEEMNPSPNSLLARRRYYTPVHLAAEGALLNINTVTSAFLPAITVDKFVAVKDIKEAERLLRGTLVHIAYPRKAREGKDLNSEEAHRKVFLQFGADTHEQTFYTVVETDKKKARRNKTPTGKERTIDPNDEGRTVEDYLRKGQLLVHYLFVSC